ncbi:MAG TPA: MBL fold metallo-hydrolase [Gemmatimonadales bacterium]|nr:MBL fold metallo-hydrolase [Gemmatimonadales bacterium]
MHGHIGGLLRWWFVERVRNPPPPDPDPATFPQAEPRFALPRASEESLLVTWVGHSTFLLQIGGLNILTDPIWSTRASPVPGLGPRRLLAPGIPFDTLPPIDAVLQSHDHYDHLDDLTVCRIEARDPGARWFVPLGLAPFLRRRGVHEIVELDWWQEAQLGSLSIGCTPAQHFSGRTPWRRDRTLWCGWSVAAANRRLLFAGDTGYHPEFARVAQRFGPFDLALLPIGAYEPGWFMRPVHMNPEDAVAAARDLGTPRVVPMHWGTFKLTDEPLDEPPQRALAGWCAAGLPVERFWQLAHGETRELPAAEAR